MARHDRAGTDWRKRLARRHRQAPRRRRSQSLTPRQVVLLAALTPAVAAVVARRRLRLPRPATLAIVSVTPLVVAALTPRRGWRYAAIWLAYMWSFTVTWNLPNENPEKLRGRLRVDYPIRIDTLIGLGAPPTLRLQRALRDPLRVTRLDRLVTLIYGSWILPHCLLAWLLFRHPEYVPRAAGRLAAAYHLTAPFYYLLPTAPPWWASEHAGRLDGEVERVRRLVVNSLLGRPARSTATPEGNPWGSMPSDHVASAAITAIGLAEVNRVYGALGWTYVGLAGFAVVYLGEHYVIDSLAGLAIAVAIHAGEPLVTPLVDRVVVGLDRIAT
ncbi:MAG TPA: phosphatase PAP2 family protein [Solirubrobacteraceae bacterium]|nr:phosphatase PAP2 family protein [Solirubrobacteraceae bacterium]